MLSLANYGFVQRAETSINSGYWPIDRHRMRIYIYLDAFYMTGALTQQTWFAVAVGKGTH